MTKRILVLGAVAVAFVVPAVSLADDGGGSAPAPAATAKAGGRAALLYRIVERQLDRRFKVFSKRCLVANAPDRCSKAATVFVKRLDRVQTRLTKMEGTIKTKCSAANAPPRCSKASQATQAIDELLSKLASDESAIKTAFPSAGSA